MPAMLTLQGLLIACPDLIQKNLVPHLPEGLISDTFTGDKFEIMLVEKCWELEVLHPEPESFGEMVDAWGSMYQKAWNAVYIDQMNIIHTEPGETVKETVGSIGSENTSDNEDSSSETGGSDTITRTVAGFNSEGWVNSEKNETDYGGTATYNRDATGERTYNSNRTRQYTRTNGLDSYELEKNRMEMNIKLNMAEMIVDMFKERFLLLVY